MKVDTVKGGSSVLGAFLVAAIGYVMTWYFLFVGIMLPGVGHPAHLDATLLATFEVGIFIFFAYFGIGMPGLGWALILLLAYCRQRLLVIAILLGMAAFAVKRTSDEIGRPITLKDIEAGRDFFFTLEGSGFLLCVVPLTLLLLLIAILLFRPNRKRDDAAGPD